MAIKSSAANQGKKTHNDKATSTLSKQKFVVKPESRAGFSNKLSVGKAESLIKKMSGAV